MNDRTTDLTQGPIVSTLVRLALPIMLSSFMSAVYNIMDMAWVGTLGARAVAGVGVAGMYMWFSGGVSALPRMGGQVNTAQAIGRKDIEEARDYAKAAIQLSLILGFTFAFLALTFTGEMVGFFHLNDDVSNACAMSYIRITCGLIMFSFLNLTLTGLYTAQGDSRTPLRANFCGVAINMILDPMLIMGIGFFPKLGSDGAAIATVIAQIIVTIVLIARMPALGGQIFTNQNYAKLAPLQFFQHIVRIGFPASLQSTAYCFISMILSRFVAAFGPEAMAVMRVGNQIEAVTWNTADGFGAALNSFCGQNYGAGKYDRIRRGFTFSIITNFLWGTVVMLIFVFAPEMISGIFFHEPSAIAISISYCTIIGLTEPFMAIEIISSGALSGVGLTKQCSIITIILTAIRIPIAFYLKGTALGVAGIWCALSGTSFIKGIVLTIAFHLWITRTRQ